MKKIINALLIASGIFVSFGVQAQTALKTAGATSIGPESATTADETCDLLGETVTINLSKAVHGAFVCDEATNAVTIATCHETGSRKPATVQCVTLGEGPDAVNVPEGCTAGTPVELDVAYRGFVANSRGGGVATTTLGGKCEDTTVTAIIPSP